MEQQKYRLNLSFPGLYREIELREGAAAPTVIGTTRNCNIRLAREIFFRDFELTMSAGSDGHWDLLCSENCYISQNGVLKLHRLTLAHGDSFVICYQNGDAELCRGEFLRDFEVTGSAYYRYVSLSQCGEVMIGGGAGCQLLLRDPAVGEGYIQLIRRSDGWQLQDRGTRYGVSVNGNRISGQTVIHDYDFFAISGHSFYLRGDRLYFCSDPMMQCTGLQVFEHRDSATRMQYPHLNRSTRVYYHLPSEDLTIQNPPAKKDPPRQNLMMTILPMVAMLLVTVLLRGVMGGGGSFILFSACSLGIGMVTTILNYRRDRKLATAGERARVEGYTAYIQKKDGELEAERQRETAILEENTPDIDRTLQTIWHFDSRLYERTPDDEDFLAVRLGSGPRDAVCPIKIHREEYKIVDDPLTDWPEQVETKYHTLPQAPVLLYLRQRGTVGVLGSEQAQYELVKLMTLDLCARHSYLDLRLCYLLPGHDTETWSWVRWLRHVSNPQDASRNIACDADSYKRLSEMLYKELTEREAQNRNSQNASRPLPHYVVFVLDAYDLMRHPISRFFNQPDNHGFTFVFCSTAAELLPKCRLLVHLDASGGRIVDAADGNTPVPFTPASVPDTQATRAAVKLASVTVDEVSLASQLTRNITLYRLLNIFSAGDLDPTPLWEQSQVYKTMAAPLGVNSKGEVVCLDLHEKAHGPHGLVAGTTGSGKSEILQSYILSMATLFHPYDVGFVIIDFKGGGMVNQFRDLPHLIGSITDIDGREINRSLLSIRAELNKRKELFAAAGVNHIDQYIKKYKNKELKTPLPHLILIVDEFAELKAEQPEFMKELISAARVGRSLGVHLILATQKPAGVVDAQIWSNSRFRLCLKVATPEDSKEMLKTPLAAEIREPGRAYLQVGNNEIFELFQSAYSGAAADSEITTGQRSYHIDQIDMSGTRTCLYKVSAKQTRRNEQTQLQEMVSMFHRYCEEHHIPRLPGICLPPLPSVISCPPLPLQPPQAPLTVTLGVYDAPEHQAQLPYRVCLTNSHILIVGASLSGKSSLLYQMIRSLAGQYTPREVNLYILDFASRALGVFSDLNHVGGCVFNDQEDRIKTLMKLLMQEVRTRKERFSEVGITSFSGYRDAGLAAETPLVVVMIDNFLAFRELYPQYDEDLLFLLREGVSVGVCLVATVSQSNGIGFRYMNTFGTRIALHCNDVGEYSNVLEHCRMQPKNTAGRAIVCIEKECYEMQTYLAFAGNQEIERVKSIHAFKKEILAQYGEQRAFQIPEIPETLDQAWLLLHDKPTPDRDPYTVTVGMDYDTVEFVRLPLASMSILSLCGKEGSGRTNTIALILDHLQSQVLTHPSECYVLDGYDRKLAGRRQYGVVRRYTSDLSEAADMLEDLEQTAMLRQEWLRNGDTELIREAPLVVMVVRNPDFYAADKKVEELFKSVFKLCRGQKILFLFSHVENAPVGYSSNGILKTIRENRSMIFTDKLDEMRLYDIPPAVLRNNKNALRTGDAYRIDGSDVARIKLAQARS